MTDTIESEKENMEIDVVKLIESAKDTPVKTYSLSENIVYDSFEGEKTYETWEEVQDIPGRLIKQGVSKNRVFYTEEFLSDPDTLTHFEGCQMYIDHQKKSEAEEGTLSGSGNLRGR